VLSTAFLAQRGQLFPQQQQFGDSRINVLDVVLDSDLMAPQLEQLPSAAFSGSRTFLLGHVERPAVTNEPQSRRARVMGSVAESFAIMQGIVCGVPGAPRAWLKRLEHLARLGVERLNCGHLQSPSSLTGISMETETKVTVLRQIPRTVWMLGCVSLFMDVLSEIIHSLLPMFLMASLGAARPRLGSLKVSQRLLP
jgi:hypothetical protein